MSSEGNIRLYVTFVLLISLVNVFQTPQLHSAILRNRSYCIDLRDELDSSDNIHVRTQSELSGLLLSHLI